MLKSLRKRVEGFTIIEVLIVLAIAGLIMLILFLAVPALNRNNRNTQRKNDVQLLLGAVTEYTTNNNGRFPTQCAAGAGNDCTLSAGAGTPTQVVNFGFYLGSQINYAAGNVAVNPTLAANTGNLYLRTGAKCNATGTDVGGVNPSARSVAAVYAIETSGGVQGVCNES